MTLEEEMRRLLIGNGMFDSMADDVETHPTQVVLTMFAPE